MSDELTGLAKELWDTFGRSYNPQAILKLCKLVAAIEAEEKQRLEEARKTAVVEFYDAVCRRAENTMLTGKLEGAHYNAMRSVLREMGIGVS